MALITEPQVPLITEPQVPLIAAEATLTECQKAIGWVIYDVVLLAVGAVGLRRSVSASSINAITQAATPALSKIEASIKTIATAGNLEDKGWAVFSILKTIYSTWCLGAVYRAFINTLTWWDAFLYAATGVATIIAVLATDGVAFVAEIVLLLFSFGFLVSDSAKAVKACAIRDAVSSEVPIQFSTEALAAVSAAVSRPFSGGDPYLFEPQIAILTKNGYLISAVENGGVVNDKVPISTWNNSVINDYTKFSLVPIDANERSFALKTFDGHFVSAMQGGGQDGPVIKTTEKTVGPWETLHLIQQPDGTYAISTTKGYFFMAQGGGNCSGSVMSTNHSTEIRDWEIFRARHVY